MKKQLISSFSIALVALLFLIASVFYQSDGCDPITAYCLKITDLLILFLIFFVLVMILSSRLKGNIDFSKNITRINLIESIIWILIIWFVIPALIWVLFPITIFYTHIFSEFDLREFILMGGLLKWKISVFILLTIPI